MKKLSLTLTLLFFSMLTIFAANLKIAWATEAVTADTSYIYDLEAAGYTVDTVENNWADLTAEKATELNAYDLVIISKRTNSSAYGGDATVRTNWQSVNTPVINLNNYINRSSRLEFFNTTVNNDNVNKFMMAVDNTHALFTNTQLTTTDSTLELSTEIFQGNDATDAGNGVVIAKDPAANIVTIAFWPAAQACYTGAGVQAGKRMFYACSYSYNLTEAGKTLFLDAVEYMISGSVTATGTTALASTPKLSVSVYPNPTTSQITVSGVKALQGAIYSVSGQMVKSLDQDNTTVDISDLAKGLYFISTQAEGKMQNISFIKK